MNALKSVKIDCEVTEKEFLLLTDPKATKNNFPRYQHIVCLYVFLNFLFLLYVFYDATLMKYLSTTCCDFAFSHYIV